MGNEATKQMLEIVDSIKSRAEQAKEEFELANDRIQAMASRSIDLFGGNAVSSVADIATEVQKMCDDLYASLQAAVVSLDSACRPLLDSKPDASAIEAVSDLMNWLNEESEISNNFTASLNGVSVGGVASGRYLPSIECKMIQNFWENQHMNTADGIKAQKQKKEQKESRYQAMIDEVEQSNRKAEQKYKALMTEYEEKLNIWEKTCKEIEGKRDGLLSEAIESTRKDILSEAEHKLEKARSEAMGKIKDAEESIALLNAETDKLNFFAFFKKIALKNKISSLSEDIIVYKGNIERANSEYENTLKNIETTLEKSTKSIKKKISSDNPLPDKPTPPEEPKLRSIAPKDYSVEDIKFDVMNLLCMSPNQNGMTVGDLLDELPVSPVVTAGAVTSALHSYMRDGSVKRKEINNSVYYSAF